MAADIKELENWVCKHQLSRSNLIKPNEIVYKLVDNYEKNEKELLVKYYPLGADHCAELTLSVTDLGLTALIADEETPDEICAEALECALIIYVTNLERKDWAIALLQKYSAERDAIKSKYTAPACLSNFFKDSFLQPLLGIPRKDKLTAVDKIIKWLQKAKTQASPNLELDENDIKALTDKELGDRIKEIAEADSEFRVAFEIAVLNSASLTSNKPPQLN